MKATSLRNGLWIYEYNNANLRCRNVYEHRKVLIKSACISDNMPVSLLVSYVV